jgi:hypothetical protein
MPRLRAARCIDLKVALGAATDWVMRPRLIEILKKQNHLIIDVRIRESLAHLQLFRFSRIAVGPLLGLHRRVSEELLQVSDK